MTVSGVNQGRAGVGPVSVAAEQVAPWIERLARVGYAAKAVLYATIGALAARAAFGGGGGTTDTRGAMRSVLEAPLGRVLLVVISLGLVGYAAWRLVQALTDPERKGNDAKGLAIRAGYAGRGIVHAGFAFTAIKLALGADEGQTTGGSSDQSQQRWTSRLLEAPAGETIVWIIGASVIGYGLYQLYRAFAAKLGDQLDLGRLSAEAGRWVIGTSRFGIGARGVVFCLVGGFLLRAAARHDPTQAGGLAASLATLWNLGSWALAVVALGLIAYGIYELANARYRRIRAT